MKVKHAERKQNPVPQFYYGSKETLLDPATVPTSEF